MNKVILVLVKLKLVFARFICKWTSQKVFAHITMLMFFLSSPPPLLYPGVLVDIASCNLIFKIVFAVKRLMQFAQKWQIWGSTWMLRTSVSASMNGSKPAVCILQFCRLHIYSTTLNMGCTGNSWQVSSVLRQKWLYVSNS